LKTVEQADLRRVGDQAILAARASAEGPLIGRDWRRLTLVADLVRIVNVEWAVLVSDLG
jgi:hypothetical protein